LDSVQSSTLSRLVADTIRTFKSNDGTPAEFDNDDEREKCERPDDPEHYRNYLAEPAPDVLKRYLQKFRSLEWIPQPQESEGKIVVDSGMGEDMVSSYKKYYTLHLMLGHHPTDSTEANITGAAI
jgi:hypothetical protein